MTNFITISPTSGANDGTFQLVPSTNTSSNSRTQTISVTSGGIVRKIIVTQGKRYITFKDSTVKSLCIANYSSDGIGVTYEDAAAVTTLGSIFSNNTSITSFDELQFFTGLTTINSSAFEYCYNLGKITIPTSVTTIGNSAFRGCNSLTIMDLTKITSVGSYAFANCIGGQLTISSSIVSIGDYAFSSLSDLTSLTFEEGLQTIGEYAFYNSNTTGIISLDLPSTITSIGNKAFYGCSNMQEVEISAVTPPTLGSDVFYYSKVTSGSTSIVKYVNNIHVLSDSLSLYKSSWSDYSSIILGDYE